LKSDYVYSLQGYKHILMKVLCHKRVSHLESLLFSQTVIAWTIHLWTKLTQIEAASNKSNHLVAIKG